jgi:hypothetical protein
MRRRIASTVGRPAISSGRNQATSVDFASLVPTMAQREAVMTRTVTSVVAGQPWQGPAAQRLRLTNPARTGEVGVDPVL